MVLTHQSCDLPCYGGESSSCLPPPSNLCVPCDPYNTFDVQMEKLVGVIQALDNPRKKPCDSGKGGSGRNGSDRGGSDRGGSDRGGSGRGGSDRSGSGRGLKDKKPCKESSQACCCKAPCTLISSLLRKLNTTNLTPSDKTSLTCVIFTELCKLSGTNPASKDDVKRNTALALAQKFGAWVDDMLEKKGTQTCPTLDIDPQAQNVLGDIFDCTCCVPKKVYPEHKATIETPKSAKKKKDIPPYVGAGAQGGNKAPMPKNRKKGKKKTSSEVAEDALRDAERLRLEAERLAAEEEARRLAKEAAEAAAKAETEAAANDVRAKALAACKEAAAKRKQVLLEKIMGKDKEDDERRDKSSGGSTKSEADKGKGHGAGAGADKNSDADKGKNKKDLIKAPPNFDGGRVRDGGAGLKNDCKANIPVGPKQCMCGGPKTTKQTFSALLCEERREPLTNCQSLDPNNSASVIEQYSKIVQHFLGTLDDMNEWIQNLVRETDQLIETKMDRPNMNVVLELEQDWKVFKNKMFLKTHHWKYFNRVAKKMVNELQEHCSCENNMESCPCPNRHSISSAQKSVGCPGRLVKDAVDCGARSNQKMMHR